MFNGFSQASTDKLLNSYFTKEQLRVPHHAPEFANVNKDRVPYHGTDTTTEDIQSYQVKGQAPSSIRPTGSASYYGGEFSKERRNYDYNYENGYQYHPDVRQKVTTIAPHNEQCADNHYDDDYWDRKPAARICKKEVVYDDFDRRLPARNTKEIECSARKVFSLNPTENTAVPSGGTTTKIYQKRMIEVSPGCFVRLRGADETWNAIWQDFYMPHTCNSCKLTIFCIQDADYVLCPACRVITPLLDSEQGDKDGGIGLGFDMKDLAQWQCDIEHRRNFSLKNNWF